MAENLNEYFSSVFTRENISILPVLETKFEGREFDYLGQLIVTPTVVAMKIRNMNDNKSPGVDGIPPKLLLKIVEQISIPLATVFNLSLEEGIVPLEWKEAKIIPLFKTRFEKQVRELQTSEFNIGDVQTIRTTNQRSPGIPKEGMLIPARIARTTKVSLRFVFTHTLCKNTK